MVRCIIYGSAGLCRLYNITGDKKFLRFMDKEYKETYEFLYDKDARLFYRDHRYFNSKRGQW